MLLNNGLQDNNFYLKKSFGEHDYSEMLFTAPKYIPLRLYDFYTMSKEIRYSVHLFISHFFQIVVLLKLARNVWLNQMIPRLVVSDLDHILGS